MKWRETHDKECGYHSWVPIARDIPGDPTSVTFFRQTQHIEAEGFRFISQYAWAQLGASTPWEDMKFEVLDDDAFDALRQRGLAGLFTWRVGKKEDGK